MSPSWLPASAPGPASSSSRWTASAPTSRSRCTARRLRRGRSASCTPTARWPARRSASPSSPGRCAPSAGSRRPATTPRRSPSPAATWHAAIARRLFLEAVKVDQTLPVEPRPLELLDRKTGPGPDGRADRPRGLSRLRRGDAATRRAARRPSPRGDAQARRAGGRSTTRRPSPSPAEHDHEALVGLLLPRAVNVRDAIREEEMSAGRGVLTAPGASGMSAAQAPPAMTSRERVLAALRREPVDRTPLVQPDVGRHRRADGPGRRAVPGRQPRARADGAPRRDGPHGARLRLDHAGLLDHPGVLGARLQDPVGAEGQLADGQDERADLRDARTTSGSRTTCSSIPTRTA